VQPAHALALFATEHTTQFKKWHTHHKNLIVLSVEDEHSLAQLMARCEERGVKYSAFREPDINNELTAIAIQPSEEAYRLTSNIPLALREGVAEMVT